MENWFRALAALAVICVAVWPRRGLIARWLASRRLAGRERREDALKHLLKREVNGDRASIESLAGQLHLPTNQTAALIEDLEDRGLLSLEGGQLQLKPSGRELALHVIRAHRLWESFLSEETGVAEAEWHQHAERKEHFLTPGEADALAARLGNPAFDPHGDAIPARGGVITADPGHSLNAAAVNAPLRVTHVEDEPPAVYAQLTAQGIRSGMRGLVLEKLPHRIRFWADGIEHVLAPVVANNISVEALRDVEAKDLLEEQFLSGLQPGDRGRVLGLSSACRGPERRRLLDLGFVPGTDVVADMSSPGGDPTAFRVRGTLIALRREQASLIRIDNLGRAPG